MNLFFVSPPEDKRFVLSEEESLHCIRVLRREAGDVIHLADGLGRFYKAQITKAHDKRCEAVMTEDVVTVPRRPYSIHLAIAPTKSIDRFEWLLEKITELGCERITPLLCEHSERTRLKTERLHKVLVAAMKQSMQAWLPQLDEPVTLQDFLVSPTDGQKFICSAGADDLLQKQYRPPANVVLCVGPEGDFSAKELDAATVAGFNPCSLVASRLRTETAGLAACHTIHVMNA